MAVIRLSSSSRASLAHIGTVRRGGVGEQISAVEAERRVARDIVERIRNGDRTAESEMIGRYRAGLSMVLRRHTGSPEDAEDIAQEVFARMLEKIRSQGIEQPERLAGYLHGFAKRLWSAQLRRKKPSYDQEHVDQALATDADPASALQRSESTELVQRYLQELELVPRDRDVLQRVFIYEQDRDRICLELEISRLHFNRVLHRAKRRMRALLDCGDSEDLFE